MVQQPCLFIDLIYLSWGKDVSFSFKSSFDEFLFLLSMFFLFIMEAILLREKTKQESQQIFKKYMEVSST